MDYLIWHSAKYSNYCYGTDMELNIHESLTGDSCTVLYEMKESDLSLVKKIVTQLNAARVEQKRMNAVIK